MTYRRALGLVLRDAFLTGELPLPTRRRRCHRWHRLRLSIKRIVPIAQSILFEIAVSDSEFVRRCILPVRKLTTRPKR